MLLFPLTLAYLILVHKAMDVSVVIRQGVQYTLARGGVKVLQGVLIAGLILTLSYTVSTHRLPLPRIIILVAVGVFVILQLQRIASRLARWIDRLFFREAYDAERLLSELGEEVRRIVETRPLLETVARRIAETLHVPRVTVLLRGAGPFQPAYAMGYGDTVEVEFHEGGTVQALKQNRAPARVYLSDPASWVNTDPAVSDQERRHLELLQAELLLPLHTKDQLLGFISLGQKKSEAAYSSNDLRLLGSVASQTALALENAQLTAAIAEEVSKRERLNRELEIAREVQEHLFPQSIPSIDTLDYVGACRPALGVGGDYYDFIEMPEGRLCFAVGDVSGKGISAALIMSNLQAALRSHAMSAAEDLASIMMRINRLIYQSSASNRYVTFFLGEYDPRARQLTYVNAGHNAPMLFRAGGELLRLSEGGLVVGLVPSVTYGQASIFLCPGDLLIAFTDGITESMNAADEEWGEDRLIETVRASFGCPSREILDQVMTAAVGFAGGAAQHDDMTLVVFKGQPDAEAPDRAGVPRSRAAD
jgi:sigma-B regulation protein RsbU (phosphoserine phosphatase)